MVISYSSRTSERGGEQADQAPGLTPSEQVRLYASECRFWGFMGGIALAVGFPALNFSIFGAIAIWAASGWLMYQANKSWKALVDAIWHDAAWLGFYHGRRQAVAEYQAGRMEA